MNDSLGEFEQIALLAVLRLEDGAYGVPIQREIKRCTERDTSPGALYTVLDRLEAKGMLTSWLGDGSDARGGRPKRFFKVTPRGLRAVRRAQQAYQKLLSGLQLLEVNRG